MQNLEPCRGTKTVSELLKQGQFPQSICCHRIQRRATYLCRCLWDPSVTSVRYLLQIDINVQGHQSGQQIAFVDIDFRSSAMSAIAMPILLALLQPRQNWADSETTKSQIHNNQNVVADLLGHPV